MGGVTAEGATLDATTRRVDVDERRRFLLTDTVGFIRRLPHHLIESFKATLEEARQADLLLHVADASSPAVFDQIAAAYAVLQEMGIELILMGEPLSDHLKSGGEWKIILFS